MLLLHRIATAKRKNDFGKRYSAGSKKQSYKYFFTKALQKFRNTWVAKLDGKVFHEIWLVRKKASNYLRVLPNSH